jgi:hypothetical protein
MVVIILFALIGVVISDTTIIINTNLGHVKGVTSSFTTNNTSYKYNLFKKIPYAKPPISDLRFRNPEPIASKTFDIIVYPFDCQFLIP